MDDAAVRWSNYESHRSTISYETRLRIISILEGLLASAEEQQAPPEYLSGIRASITAIRDRVNF